MCFRKAEIKYLSLQLLQKQQINSVMVALSFHKQIDGEQYEGKI